MAEFRNCVNPEGSIYFWIIHSLDSDPNLTRLMYPVQVWDVLLGQSAGSGWIFSDVISDSGGSLAQTTPLFCIPWICTA